MSAETNRSGWAVTTAVTGLAAFGYNFAVSADPYLVWPLYQREALQTDARLSRSSTPMLDGSGKWLKLTLAPEQSNRAAQMAAVWSHIQTFSALCPDWAGPGSVAAKEDTISLAREVIRSIPASVPPPHVAPSYDGEVVFTWLRGGNRIEAALDVDGHLSWASNTAGKISPGGDIRMDTDDLTAFNKELENLFA